jgi:predicted transposase YdaD
LLEEKTRYLKENPKGVSEMCKVLEDMRNEALEQGMILGRAEGRSEGIAAGRAEGISLGRQDGIAAFIEDFSEEGFSRERIIEKLVKRFSISQADAYAYYEKYAKPIS